MFRAFAGETQARNSADTEYNGAQEGASNPFEPEVFRKIQVLAVRLRTEA